MASDERTLGTRRTAAERREAELRHLLVEAIYHDRVRDAAWREHQLRHHLGERAAGDPDLEIAHRWLEEQAELDDERSAESRRTWLKLLLTGLPLLLATLLTLLLAGVLIWG
jgi:hypothetical protein